jgi:beta-hydroxyacyl-ACP dehydratase FabZ
MEFAMNIEEILQILPHRYPFLLVDRVVDLEPGRRIVGIKNVSVNEPFFQGHFPGRPIMPGVLIVEAMAQVCAVLAFRSGKTQQEGQVYFVGIDACRFRKPVIPGDQLRIESAVQKSRPPYWWMDGKVFVDGQLVCEASLTAMVK